MLKQFPFLGDGLAPIFEHLNTLFEGIGSFFEVAGSIIGILILIYLVIYFTLVIVLFIIFNLLFFKLNFFEKYRKGISKRRKIAYRFLIFILSNLVVILISNLLFI